MNRDSLKILVADDDVKLLKVYAFTLKEAGYDVTAVSSGEAAHSALVAERFDLAVTDIQMGGAVSGVRIAGQAILDYPRTKIIVITGMVGLRDSAVGLEGVPGAHATLFKPVDPPALVDAVEKVLAQ